MNNQSLFQPILTYVRTTHEADELYLHIDTFLTQYYKVQKDPFDKLAYTYLDPAIAKTIQQIFDERKLSWQHFEEVKQFLTELKKCLTSCDVITLTLPNEPTNDDITGYVTWIRNNLEAFTIIETHVDPTILGGVVVIYKGHYIDQSIKKRLSEYFSNHAAEVLQKLRPVEQIRTTPTDPIQTQQQL